ncbi:hypothetical protein [Nocardia stercoris]|uniref:hypothetical protein n=1 Tax=Nocardia stercoris TaxID=2483361 RepID=UPI001F1EE5E5|nr:hypothetical protein [Nocardia stercoris]
MTSASARSTGPSAEHVHGDGFGEFTEELRLLAETLLERVEPVLRRAAAESGADAGPCAWCPMCAAAALLKGDHHDVVAAIAGHGTAIVTVLREALAGVPVEPVLPPEFGAGSAAPRESAVPEPDSASAPKAGATPAGSAAHRPPRGTSGYVSIPVTIKV